MKRASTYLVHYTPTAIITHGLEGHVLRSLLWFLKPSSISCFVTWSVFDAPRKIVIVPAEIWRSWGVKAKAEGALADHVHAVQLLFTFCILLVM